MPRAHLARVLWSCTAGALLVLAIQPVGASKATGSIAAPGSILWAKTYDGPAHDRDIIGSLGVSPDGTKVFVTGGSIDVPGLPNDDYTTIAYDASTGAMLWLQRYDGPGLSDISNSLGVSPDGTKVFVTGSSEATDFGFSDYATVAYDASTGAMLWVARYDGPLALTDGANNLGVNPDGTKVFVTGSSTGQPSGCEFIGAGKGPTGPPVQDLPCFDYATIAYDAVTGASLWVKRFDGPKSLNDEARALGVSPDGTKVFVSGASESVQQNDDFATVAYSAATGNQLWVKRYGSAGPGDDAPTSVGVTPDGTKVFATGRSWGGGDDDYATIAYSATSGATLWTKRYNGPGNHSGDQAESLATSPDGSRVFVTGGSREEFRPGQFATIAYDAASGATVWVNRYSHGSSGGRSVGVAPGGTTVFVAGICGGSSSNFDFCTMAIDAVSGARLWVSRYNGPPKRDDFVQDLGVSPDGSKVFVAGSTWARGDGDFATVAHSTG